MDFEDILLEVGDYGKYQKHLIMIFLLPAASLLPWFTMNILFMVSVPEHWCKVPELLDSNLTIAQQRLLISPENEKCYRYNLNYTDIEDFSGYTVPNGSTTRPCDQGWQYDQTYYDSTAATQWNMVCEDGHFVSFVLSMYNVGSIIGTPIYGSLSDKIGRRITFFITVLVTCVTGILSVFVTDFTWFVVIKTINGSLMPSVFQLPYIIILEIVAPEVRTRMNAIVNLSWTFGMCFLPLLAYYLRNWITLGLVTSVVTLLFFLYYKFLPESPRWLLSQERYEEAATILCKIGKKNGQVIEKKELNSKLQKLGEKLQREKTVDGVNNSSLDLLRYPQLRKRFIIITFCWISNIMSYYGLQINISNLAGNEFINFFLLAVAEIPGYLTSWFVMEKIGRRWCSVFGFLLTGLVCMLPVINFPHVDVISSMLGKFFAAGTFMATYQQSSELYPTVVRSIGMGMSSTVAMMATLIVPYLIYLGVYGKAIPFVVIGFISIIAGLMATFLPETLNENLPQSIFDAEKFGRKQNFFSMNRRRRSISRERAASIGLKIRPLETISGSDNITSKPERNSLHSMEFISMAAKNSVLPETVTIPNGGWSRKRNSADSSIDKPRQRSVSNVPEENSKSERSPSLSKADDNEDSVNNMAVHQPKGQEAEKGYVNMVFENSHQDGDHHGRDVVVGDKSNQNTSKVDV